MAGSDGFLQAWPAWTDGLAGTTVVDVLLGWSVDTAFDQLWGAGTDFSAHVREVRSIKDYVEGPWVKDADLWESVNSGEQSRNSDSPHTYVDKAEYAGRSRRVTFSQSTGSGLMKSTYVNEEVQRCIEAEPGKSYVMNCTVGTNAPYGDRFKILLRYRLEVATIEEKPACSLRVSYSLNYIKPTNGMMKGVIGSGVDGGVRKNFGVLRELMAELVEIRDNKGGTGDAPASVVAQAPRVAVEAAIEGSTALTGVLRQLAAAEQQLLSAAGPAAAWLGRRLSGTQVANSLPLPVSQQTGTVIISVAVAAVFMKAALYVKALIDAPLAEYCTTDGCIPGMGQFVCFLYSVSHIIDMPDSLREVVGCVVLLTLVQQLGAFVLERLPLQGVASSEPWSGSAEEVPVGEGEASVGSEEREVAEEAATSVAPAAAESEEAKAAPAAVKSDAVTHEMSRQLTSLKTGLKGISSSIMKSTQGMVNDVATSMQRATPPPHSSRSTTSNPPTPILSPTTTEGKSPPGAEKGADACSVPDCAELFENERYQPLRGWGHSWPGHLMPGDCSHWSNRDGAGSSMVCSEVRPRLPDGYRWSESGWWVDMSGVGEERVDDEGWSYGVHWKWVTYPPALGSGKKKFGYHFVRRRRWVRRWRALEEGEDCEDGEDGVEPDLSIHREVGKELKAAGVSNKLSSNTIVSTIASVGDILKTGSASSLQAAPVGSPPVAVNPSVSDPPSGTTSPASRSSGRPSAEMPRKSADEAAPSDEHPLATGDSGQGRSPDTTPASLMDKFVGERDVQVTAEVGEEGAQSGGVGAVLELEASVASDVPGAEGTTEQRVSSSMRESSDQEGGQRMADSAVTDDAEGDARGSIAVKVRDGDSLVAQDVLRHRGSPGGLLGDAEEGATTVPRPSPVSEKRPGHDVPSSRHDVLRQEGGGEEGYGAEQGRASSSYDASESMTLPKTPSLLDDLDDMAPPSAGARGVETPLIAMTADEGEVETDAARSQPLLAGVAPTTVEPLAASCTTAATPHATVSDSAARGRQGAVLDDGEADFLGDLSAPHSQTDPPPNNADGGAPMGRQDGAHTSQPSARDGSTSPATEGYIPRKEGGVVGVGKPSLGDEAAVSAAVATTVAGVGMGGGTLMSAPPQSSDKTTPSSGSAACDGAAVPRAEDAGAAFMRMVHPSNLKGAVVKMDTVFKNAGATLEKTTTDMVQAVKTNELSGRPSARKSGSGERRESEDSKAQEGADGDVWHRKAVKDMKRLAGEVNTDSMNAAAQRMSAEMNVAAKKLTGEMNGAARKLTGLFGGRGGSFSGGRHAGGREDEVHAASVPQAAVKPPTHTPPAPRPPRKNAKDD